MSRPKVTRSAQPGPQFPSRHLKPVPLKPPPPVPPPGQVEPVRTRNAKAHYGWGDRKVAAFWTVHNAAVIALAFTALPGAWWVYEQFHLAANEVAYARIGYELCREPLLSVPEYTCAGNDLDCFTRAPEAIIKRYEAQARAVNEWRAERCLPLM